MGLMHKAEIALGMETDTSEIVNEMIESVRNFGRCGITGVYVGFVGSTCCYLRSLLERNTNYEQTNYFNIGSLIQRGIRLIRNGQAPVHLYWEKICEMIRQREFDPLQIVTHRVRLEDLETVYKKFDAREDGI